MEQIESSLTEIVSTASPKASNVITVFMGILCLKVLVVSYTITMTVVW